MYAMATALFGSPLALQIYLIAHARISDIKISNFGWPVASLSSSKHQFSSEQEPGKPSENTTMTPTTNSFDPPNPDPAVMPRIGKAVSVSYTAVGRGLYRREVTAHEEAAESQRAIKGDEQGIPAATEPSVQSKATPNLFIGRKLEEIRSESKRYAPSAATASAISQSRNDRFRETISVLPEDPMHAAKISGRSAGHFCERRNRGSSVEERKDSAAFMFERKLEHVKRTSQARGPNQAVYSWKATQCEVERSARGAGEK